MRDLGVNWPVVQDNDYAQWKAYGNEYWPAHYFIDAKGRVRYWHFGEGGYAESESSDPEAPRRGGTTGRRGSRLGPRPRDSRRKPRRPISATSGGKASPRRSKPDRRQGDRLSPRQGPGSGEWNLKGQWTITGQYVAPEGPGSLWLGFDAKDVYLVAQPAGAEGQHRRLRRRRARRRYRRTCAGGSLKPDSSRLYHVVALPEGGTHVLRLEVRGKRQALLLHVRVSRSAPRRRRMKVCCKAHRDGGGFDRRRLLAERRGATNDAHAGVETALFAGGCFWSLESAFDKTYGVIAATSGYTGGTNSNPTYDNYELEDGHVEAVHVAFDTLEDQL